MITQELGEQMLRISDVWLKDSMLVADDLKKQDCILYLDEVTPISFGQQNRARIQARWIRLCLSTKGIKAVGGFLLCGKDLVKACCFKKDLFLVL